LDDEGELFAVFAGQAVVLAAVLLGGADEAETVTGEAVIF
jgi:hypothetical protein